MDCKEQLDITAKMGLASSSTSFANKNCTMCPGQVALKGKTESPEEIATRGKYFENFLNQLYLSHITRCLNKNLCSQSTFPLCDQCLETLKHFQSCKSTLENLFESENDEFADWIFNTARECLVADLIAAAALEPSSNVVAIGGFEAEKVLPTNMTLMLLRNAIASDADTEFMQNIMMKYRAGPTTVAGSSIQPDFNLSSTTMTAVPKATTLGGAPVQKLAMSKNDGVEEKADNTIKDRKGNFYIIPRKSFTRGNRPYFLRCFGTEGRSKYQFFLICRLCKFIRPHVREVDEKDTTYETLTNHVKGCIARARCPSPDITNKKAMKRYFAALEED